MTTRTRKSSFAAVARLSLTCVAIRAEYILEAIGAGATATTDVDWKAAWNQSPEAVNVQEQLERIHSEGRSKPPVQARLKSKYPTSWWYQMVSLLRRDAAAHWRDPVYLLAKIVLNIAAALFIGFTFFKAKTTIQGTQNHLFVSNPFPFLSDMV